MNNNNNNNRTAIILSLFAGQRNTITTPRSLIEITGCHILGLILNQCIFWSPKSTMYTDGWFYKTYEDWFSEIHIPERTLRRKLDKLEKMGFIKTKVKKVYGVNTKHILPNIDAIIDSILAIEDNNHPDRPSWPNGATHKQVDQNQFKKPCTNIAPTGQVGRLETATLADSIYTEEYIQNNTTTTNEPPLKESSGSGISFEKNLSKNQAELLKHKCEDDKRTDEEFLMHCEHHVKNNSDSKKSLYQRNAMLLKLLKLLKGNGEHFKSHGYTSPTDLEKQKQIETARLKAQEEQHKKRMNEYTKEIKTKKASTQRTGLNHCSQILDKLKV